MSTAPIRFAASFRALASIDAQAGVIRGVSVITEGEAKGHGMLIDSTTLEQVKACAAEYSGGLKVKISTQRGHLGDVAEIVGFLTGFRVDGAKLLADLHLLENSPHRAHIMEMAEKIPDTFGLSISFSGPVETKDKAQYARCTEIYSADLVSEPAANPTGLFSNPASAPAQTGKHQPATHMEENKPDPLAEIQKAIEGLSARLSKLEMPPKVEVEIEKPEEMSAKLEKVAELSAQNALKLFAAQFGTPPAAASAAKETVAESKPVAKKFEEIVREHPEYAKSKKAALAATISAHPKEYADYNQRVRSGEIIMF